jgi:hypothetical protein
MELPDPEGGAEFDPGDEVTIKGKIEGVIDGQVDIEVESGDSGEKLHEKEGVDLVDDGEGNGLFEHKFMLPEEGYYNEEDPSYTRESFVVTVIFEGEDAGGAFFDVLLESELSPPDFSLDKDTYSRGEDVVITGLVEGSNDGDEVVIDASDPDGEKIVDAVPVTITDEEFTYTFTIPDDALIDDNEGYTVDVTYEDTLTETKNFSVEGDGDGNEEDNTSSQTLIRTDRDEYDPGDEVKLTGSVAGANDGEFAEINVLGPDDKVLQYVSKKNVAVTAGNFTFTFALDDDAEGGTYEATIKFEQETKSATFRVTGATAPIPTAEGPTLQLPLKIGKIRVETDGERYEQGDQIQITGTVDGAYDKDEAEITVFGPDNEPIDDVDKRRRMIVDERYSLSFNLDRDSDIGMYRVLVKALGDEEDAVFVVEGEAGSTDDPFRVETDDEVYSPGDSVEVSGKVEAVEDGTDVLITVYDPNGEVLSDVDEKKDSISDEEFTFSFDLDLDSPPGRYKVFVLVDGDSEDTVFTVGGEDSGPRTGVSVRINDESLAIGDLAIVTITAQGAEDGDTVEYTIFGPDNNEVDLASLSLSGQGEVNSTENRHVFSFSFTDERAGGYAILADFSGELGSAFFDFEGEGGGGADAGSFVETDKLNYDPGDTVQISGTIDGAADGTVNVIVDDPEADEGPALLDEEVTITDESFSTEFDLAGDATGLFVYHVRAVHDDDTFRTFFGVVDDTNPTTLDVEDSYDAGEQVTISGTSEGAEEGGFADISIFDQDDNFIDGDVIEMTGETFEFTFTIDSEASGRAYVTVLAPACCTEDSAIRVFGIANEGTGGPSLLPSLETDEKSYEAGDDVTISGTFPGVADDEAKISILEPQGTPVSGADEESAPITSGDFSFDFTLADDAEDGLYRVKAEAPNGDEVYTFFGIGQDQDIGGGASGFTVTTENTLYNLGNEVIISGTVDGEDGQKVRLIIKEPDDGEPADGTSKRSVNQEIEGGEYSYALSISERDDEGVYFVEATFGGDEIFTYFDVEEKSFDIEIETDETEYELGDIVEISGKVTGAEDGDKVEITVTTPNGETLDEVDEVRDKVVDEEFEFQFRLNEGGNVGVHSILVNFEDDESIEYGYFDVLGARDAKLVRVVTDKNSYAPGDAVVIGGIASIAKDGQDIDLTVYDPFDEPIPVAFHEKLDVAEQQFSFQFQLPTYAPQGVYEVHAIFFDHTDFTKFQVIDVNDLRIGSLVQSSNNKLFVDGIGVDFQTNSELSSIRIDEEKKSVTMMLEGDESTEGFVKIGIGKILQGEYTVLVDGEETDNFTIQGDAKSEDAVIEISYPHSLHEVVIVGTQVVPEFPVVALVPLTALLGIIVVITRTNLRGRIV